MSQEPRIGDELIEAGLISEADLTAALKRQKETDLRLGEILIQMERVSERRFYGFLARKRRLPYVTLEQVEAALDLEVARSVPPEFSDEHELLPYARSGEKLYVLVTESPSKSARELLTRATGASSCHFHLASRSTLEKAKQAVGEGGAEESAPTAAAAPSPEEQTPTSPVEKESPEVDESLEVGSGQKILGGLLRFARSRKVRAVHIEPGPDGVSVRFRFERGLRPAPDLGGHSGQLKNLIPALKEACHLEPEPRPEPRSGLFSRTMRDGEEARFQVVLQPTVHGEGAVVQIPGSVAPAPAIADLGLASEVEARLRRLLQNPQGLILMAGPEGGGRDRLIRAILTELQEPSKKILAAETRVGRTVPGVIHCPVSRTGGGFARQIRSFLNQDADILYVSEIPTPKVARLCLRAALSGHLVLAAVHALDAVDAMTHLRSLRARPERLASACLAVVAQRCVPVLCDECRKEVSPGLELLREFFPSGPPSTSFFDAEGCAACSTTGRDGEALLCEVWELNEDDRDRIRNRRGQGPLREGLLGRVHGLVRAALDHAIRGEVALADLRTELPAPLIERHLTYGS